MLVSPRIPTLSLGRRPCARPWELFGLAYALTFFAGKKVGSSTIPQAALLKPETVALIKNVSFKLIAYGGIAAIGGNLVLGTVRIIHSRS